MAHDRPLSPWVTVPLLGGALLALAALERARRLRRYTEPKLRREARNAALGGFAAAAAQFVDAPAVNALMRTAERRRWGLLRRLRLPPSVEIPLACAALDYSFYLWHILLHRVPFLWRFHLVHHADLDLDASTAVRFHFAEIALAVPFRAATIRLLGPSMRALSVWQLLFALEVIFHHSNLELPPNWERRLARFVVTPGMHGIHHSAVREETNSNWSSGLALWDRLHGTFRLDVPQQDITIGLPAFRDPAKLTLRCLLRMPFRRLPNAWSAPERAGIAEPAGRGILPPSTAPG
jgi:sterol desaturase/sphingolipid hydroxylase (fatty acid hydroxylase superfamily)